MHHPGADVQRLHVQRRERGRGLMQMKMTFKTSKIEPHKYLSTTNAWMLQLVLFYTGFHSIVMHLNKNFTYKIRKMRQPLVHYRRKKSKEKLRDSNR